MNFKFWTGICLIIAGIVLGIYLGVIVLFIGGITQIAEQVKLEVIDGGVIAWGILKILSATTLGFLSAFMLIIPGFAKVVNNLK
jgi:hypothetical protein